MVELKRKIIGSGLLLLGIAVITITMFLLLIERANEGAAPIVVLIGLSICTFGAGILKEWDKKLPDP